MRARLTFVVVGGGFVVVDLECICETEAFFPVVGFDVVVLELKLRPPVPGLRNFNNGLLLRLDSVVDSGITVSMTSSSDEDEATCSVTRSTFSSSTIFGVVDVVRNFPLAKVGRILKREPRLD